MILRLLTPALLLFRCTAVLRLLTPDFCLGVLILAVLRV